MSVVMKAFRSMLAVILELLTDSTFSGFINKIISIPYIGFLNYFVPISDFISILTAWGTAIATYYVFSAILRTINAID